MLAVSDSQILRDVTACRECVTACWIQVQLEELEIKRTKDNVKENFENWMIRERKKKTEMTFGTAAWKIKSVKVLGDRFIKVAWTFVSCGFPDGFANVNSIFKVLLSYATIGGYAGPLVAAIKEENKVIHLRKRVSMICIDLFQ